MEHQVAHDRISGLPEPILHHILSFLLIEDAIKIARTCKRLNQVWNTVPYLDFGDHFFPISPPDDDDSGSIEDTELELLTDIITKRKEKLFTFVEQTLSSRRMQGLTVHKFRLRWSELDVELRRYLDGWITNLVQHCNIKELGLLGGDEEWYNLPSILLTATSLRSLTLLCCIMPCGLVDLSSLNQLVLDNVHLSEKMLLDIINTCHGLEKLSLWQCPGMKKRIFIPGKSHLKTLDFVRMLRDGMVDEVVIEAHHLESLSYSAGTRPIKVNIITNFGGSLKFLHLCGANITSTWFCELMSRLSRLEELKLTQLNLKVLKISSSSLKRLVLRRVFCYKDIKFGEFMIDTPNLVHLTYDGDLLSVFQNSMAVKEVHLNIKFLMHKGPSEQLWSELMQFMNKFDYSEVVSLDCTRFENMIFPAEMRTNVHTPPLAHIKHFVLEGKFRSSPVDLVDAVSKLYNVLRWIAPNLDSLSLKPSRYWKGNSIDLKFTAAECDCLVSRGKCKCLPKYELKGSSDNLDCAPLMDYLDESFKDLHGCDWFCLPGLIADCGISLD